MAGARWCEEPGTLQTVPVKLALPSEEFPEPLSPGASTVQGEPAPQPEPERFEATHRCMGVSFTIVGYATDEAQARLAVANAFGRIDQLDKTLSDYDRTSEACRLAELPDSDPDAVLMEVTPPLATMLRTSVAWSQATDGAFDITVGPLTQLWRTARKNSELPAAEEIAQARERVGYRLIRVADDRDAARLTRPGMTLDFGGIAQGYAADEALRIMQEHGISSCLIDASGDVRLGDPPPGRNGWRVAVAELEAGAEPSVTLSVANHSVSTSGDAFQFVEINGRRYSHILDPRTGAPVEGRSSVTVIAPDGTTADALASALSVMGPDQGLEWVEAHPGIEALFVTVKDDQPIVRRSAGFDRWLEKE